MSIGTGVGLGPSHPPHWPPPTSPDVVQQSRGQGSGIAPQFMAVVLPHGDANKDQTHPPASTAIWAGFGDQIESS